MLTLADLNFAVVERGSVWPWTWNATREGAEAEAIRQALKDGKTYDVMTEAEFDAKHDAHFLEGFPLQEITPEFYDEMLNVLPPMYRPGALGFFMCEFTAGTITTQFARVNGRYYGAAVNIRDQSTWITQDKVDAGTVLRAAVLFSEWEAPE